MYLQYSITVTADRCVVLHGEFSIARLLLIQALKEDKETEILLNCACVSSPHSHCIYQRTIFKLPSEKCILGLRILCPCILFTWNVNIFGVERKTLNIVLYEIPHLL